MPMQENERRQYQQQAGLTDEQLEQATGAFTVSDVSARASGLSEDHIAEVRQALRQLAADATILTTKYAGIARRENQDARQLVEQHELDTDRTHLASLIADEYRFTTPLGTVEDKQATIDRILSGGVRAQMLEGGGFQTMDDELQVHGTAAVMTATQNMRGTLLVQDPQTGAVRERDVTGTYRITNTYIYRDGRWQLTASHMSEVASSG
jgi:hypothetical protein